MILEGHDTGCHWHTARHGWVPASHEIPLASMERHGTIADSCHDYHVAVHYWMHQAHGAETHVTHCYGQFSEPHTFHVVIANDNMRSRLSVHWSLLQILCSRKRLPKVHLLTNTCLVRFVRSSLPRLVPTMASGFRFCCLLRTSLDTPLRKTLTLSLASRGLPQKV
jgi:hypothetical protein